MIEEIYFRVETPLGIVVRTTKTYWLKIISTKHSVIEKYESEIKNTLKDPDEVRRSKQDQRVHLYYKYIGKVSVCIVVDHVNEKEGYIITAYLTDRIKEGEKVYDKN